MPLFYGVLWVANQLLLITLAALLAASIVLKVGRVALGWWDRRWEARVEPWLSAYQSGGLTLEELVRRARPWWLRKALEQLVLKSMVYVKGGVQEGLVAVLESLGTVRRLRRQLRQGVTPWHRTLAAYWLSIIRSPEAFPDLVEALKDRDRDVRFAAVRAMVQLPHARQALIPMIKLLPELPLHRGEAVTDEIIALGLYEDQEVRALLAGQLRDASPRVRYWAVVLLGEVQAFEAAGELSSRVRDPDPTVREAAARALGRLGDPQQFHALSVAATDPEWKVRLGAVQAIERLGHPGAIPALTLALLDRQWEVNEAAIRAISTLDPRGAVLRGLLESPHPFVRWRAAEMLEFRGDLDALIAGFATASREGRGETLRTLRLAADNRAAQPFLRYMAAANGPPASEAP